MTRARVKVDNSVRDTST